MTAPERIALLAPVVAEFPEMGEFGDQAALLELVRKEWPDSMRPPDSILHIISANTAMAGMQSLVRGLILGSKNWCKIPGVGLPRFVEMVERLPKSLQLLVEISERLPAQWMDQADAVIVFGNDATVAEFQRQTRPEQIFAGYGNRWSGAVIFADPDFQSVEPLVRDICLYEQMGCLSPQIVWLDESIEAVEYGQRLAESLARYVSEHPVAKLDSASAASVARWRSDAEWKAVSNPQDRVWLSGGEPVWGVALVTTAGLSCLHRHVSLVKFSNLPILGKLSESVSSLGVWPISQAGRLEKIGASRVCAAGEMQFPKPDWQQDGQPALGRLLRKK